MATVPSRRQELEDATLQDLRRAIALGFGRAGRATVVGRLGLSHHMALHPILRGGPLAQRDIAEAFGVTPARVTGVLDDLERAGAVRRERNREDRREVLVRVTPAGRALHAEFHRAMFRQLSGLFRGLNDDELQSLRALLRRLAEAHGRPPRSASVAEDRTGIAQLSGLPPGLWRPGTLRAGRRRRPGASSASD